MFNRLILALAFWLAFAASATAQTPMFSWHVNVGSTQYGIASFGTDTHICYGSGVFWVPYPPEQVVAVMVVIPVLTLLGLVFALSQSIRFVRR